MLEKLFHLQENKTDVRTEVIAGITTFMTMAYVLAVNPSILAVTGMDSGAVFTATILASVLGSVCMALFANYPYALAPGMGLNAFFAYTIVLGYGYPWQAALAAVFVEGLIFIVLSFLNVREEIFNSIPMNLKKSISVGIGLFIAFIGLQNSKIVLGNSATMLALFSLEGLPGSSMTDAGITVLLAMIGTIITSILVINGVKGNILFGILITWILGIVCQLTGFYIPNFELGFYSLLPDFSGGFGIPSIAPIFAKLDFQAIPIIEFVVIVCAFLFVDMFDTLGTLIGVAAKADMLDKDGKLPNVKGALMADAVATTVGAVLGTSTTTTYVESAAGVTEGGRTGLTAMVTAALFALALFFSPIFLAIPSFATAPALIVVGFYMVNNIGQIDFADFSEGIPAFICILAMPFMYSISEGIAMGVISYVFINVLSGKSKEKKISPIMYALLVFFLLKYTFL
ncbi:MAG: NCS2 family permease [Bacillota bacterium]